MATRPAGGFIRFSQESWQELQKVTWPSRETVIRLTAIVIVISALIAAYIFVFDNVFTLLITKGILNAPDPSSPPLTQ